MLNPNPIPAVGSRWLKSRGSKQRGATPVEVEVLANDERNATGDLMIRYREIATQYVRRLQFFTWRMPSYVRAIAAPATSVASRPMPRPMVDAPYVESARDAGVAPQCKGCGAPCVPRVDRGRTHGTRWRVTCSDECMRQLARSRMVQRNRLVADAIAAVRPPFQSPATQAPAARRATKLRAAERGERLTIYLPPAVARALRMRCADQNRSASDAVATAVLAWLTEPTSPPMT